MAMLAAEIYRWNQKHEQKYSLRSVFCLLYVLKILKFTRKAR